MFRPSLRYLLQGIKHLTKYLEKCTVKGVEHLDDNTAELCCESLKIIFNLLLSNEKPSNLLTEATDDIQLQRDLIKIVRQLLFIKSSASKMQELKRFVKKFIFIQCFHFYFVILFPSHTINLLTSMVPECYEELIPQNVTEGDDFQGHDVTSLVVLLDFLEERLGKVPFPPFSPTFEPYYKPHYFCI